MTGIRESERKGGGIFNTKVSQSLCIPFVIQGITSLSDIYICHFWHILLISFLSPLPYTTPSCPMDPAPESSSVFSAPSAHIPGLQGQLQCPCHSTLCSGRRALPMASMSLYIFYINYRRPSNSLARTGSSHSRSWTGKEVIFLNSSFLNIGRVHTYFNAYYQKCCEALFSILVICFVTKNML